MNRRAKWICAPIDTEQAGTAFVRTFDTQKEIKKATLSISAIGLYSAYILNVFTNIKNSDIIKVPHNSINNFTG